MALLHNVIITAQVTYSQLVTMINSSTLAPAHYYEITDYRTIYKQPMTDTILGGAASAVPSKPFPVIVRALTSNTLSTDAFASATVDFPNANAWKLKYDVNLPISFDIFTSIDWPSVTQPIADNIAIILDEEFGYDDAYGLTPAAMQTYVDVTFAGNEGVTAPEAEQMIYEEYGDSYSPALPINTTPTLFYDTKYSWADITSRGVIFELTDENDNTVAYDFKNVRFVRDVITGESGLTTWLNTKYYDVNVSLPLSGTADQFYTFNFNPTATLGANEDASNDPSLVGGVNSNKIGQFYETVNGPTGGNIQVRSLNNNVFLLDTSFGLAHGNTIDDGSQNNTFGASFNNNKFGVDPQRNKINTQFVGNRIGGNASDNTIDDAFSGNVISEFFNANTFAGGAYNNTFGIFFSGNSVDTNFNGNSIGENCQSNSFAVNCSENDIGVNFASNAINNTFTRNNVATNCTNNTFNGSATSNTLGPEFKSNTIASGGSGFNGNQINSRIQSCNFNATFVNNFVTSGFTSKTFPASTNFVYNLENSVYSIGSTTNATFFTTRANNFIMSQTLPNLGTLTGHSNVGITSAVGMSALTSGSQNTAIGELSLALLTSGIFNTGIGATALRRVTIGSYNTSIGNQAGQFISTGSYNTGFGGLSAGTLMGSFNIQLGAANITNLGSATETIGDGNILIGKDTQRTKNTVNDNIVIGNLSYAQNTSGTTILGNSINTTLSNVMILGGSAQNVILGDSAPIVNSGYRLLVNATSSGGIYLNGGSVVFAQGNVTGSSAISALDVNAAWNTSGNITLIKANAVNTASGATSKLLDLQIGGVSKFVVDKNGQVIAGGYGTGAFTGTVSNLLSVTSAGAVIETPLASISPWTISSNDIYNSNSGNVGIGTASPTAGKLQVSQMATASETTVAIRPIWNTSGTPTALEVNPQIISSTNNTSKLIDVKYSGTSRFTVQQDGTVNFNTYGAGTFAGTVSRYLAVTSAGKVIETAPQNNPPGVYFSPAQQFDSSFVVFASAIVYPSNAFVNNDPITWSILDHTSAHNSSFYTSAVGNSGNQRLQINYPVVKNVINTTITVDESFAGFGVIVGSTTGMSDFQAPAYQTRSVGIRLTGNGSGTWTKSNDYGIGASFDVTTFNTGDGGTSLNINAPILRPSTNEISIQYIGPNNYGIQRVYSGLGAYNIKFILIDRSTGLAVTTNPTTSDEIIITNAGIQMVQVSLANWQTGVNDFMGTFTNFWIFGVFECWLVANAINTSSILVRFQPNYPSATNYKIYRDTNPAFSSATLIYTGTSGEYVDTGLTTDTLYYYKMVAVIASVDTDITTFRTNTKAY